MYVRMHTHTHTHNLIQVCTFIIVFAPSTYSAVLSTKQLDCLASVVQFNPLFLFSFLLFK